jgi:hypothetical protein
VRSLDVELAELFVASVLDVPPKLSLARLPILQISL